MDFAAVIQGVSNVGFPICVALLCFWYIKSTTETHKQEIDKLSEAVNNNTLALQKLSDKMEAIDK